MKIKRLEIIGFKSFVDKTVLDFQQGITAVVGPNGCGKSNIVDAIRWVMGEQSAKNLRGSNMEDVIFIGSDLRKPLGMAEVSIVFSTDDGRVPAKYLNFHEVQVTRRLYRDGESEYFINKTPCRLLDISELFMDTGVGTRAYSVIEQGKIGMILHAKPEERRFIIEEAAGITKFKARKKIALRKIEVTKQNLLRIGDIISEIKRQLNALQRQAKKAEAFRQYREELKETDLLIFARHYAMAIAAKKGLEEELLELKREETALHVELQQGELSLEERKLGLLEEEKGLALAQEEIYRAKTELQAFENRLEFQRKELANLERHKARIEDELTVLERQLAEAEDDRRHLEDKKGQETVELAEEERQLQEKEGDLGRLSAVEVELSRRLEEARRGLFKLLNDIAQWSNRYSSAVRKMESLDERFERSRREKISLHEKLGEVSQAVLAGEAGVRDIKHLRDELSEELSLQRAREEELKRSLQVLEQELQEKRDLLTARHSRLQSLQELEARFEGYGEGVKSLLLSDRFKGKFKGTVAKHIESRPEHEAAVESALGDVLQYLVGADDGDVLDAVDYLRQSSAGRGTFILPGVAKEISTGTPDGAIPLADVVTITPEFRDTISPVFTGVFLVQDVSTAVSLTKRYPALSFVTTDGDMASRGGIVTGGSTGTGLGLIHKKREIKDLLHQTATLAEEVEKIEGIRAQTKSEIGNAEESVRELGQRFHESEIKLVNAEKDLQRLREEDQRVRERLDIKDLDDDQLREERNALLAEMEESHRLREDSELARQSVEASVVELEHELAVRKEELAALRELVTSAKVRVAALREKRESGSKAAKRADDLIKDLQSRLLSRREELAAGGAEREKVALILSRSDTELKELLKRQIDAETRHAAVRQRFDAQAEVVREEELRLKSLRSRHDGFRQTVSDKSLRLSELAMKTDHLAATVLDRYRLDIEQLTLATEGAEFDEESLRRRQADLQRMIDELGEVNLMAVEEYNQLEERFQFLTSQQADLQDSMQALQQAIQRINKTTKKRFLETFELVNAKFQEVFPRLFCGGKAELRLTNEEDLLETGIDITAQPPGKKLQNITALSGGEKALTAVALIFSIFLIKPSPFCLLDEVDAPLDDANIGRFNEMVREMSAISQFIIISHNKTTMAIADVLYGVTMEEPGVSKLVSVKLNQAA